MIEIDDAPPRILLHANSAEFRKKMADIGAEPIGDTPQQMAQQIKDDTLRFGKLVKDAKVSME